MDLVVFDVAGLRYALPAGQVAEVVRAVTIVPLPGAPPIVEGVIDVRGSLVPVLDFRARFRLPPKPVAHTDHLLLASVERGLVAIRADRALDLVSVAEADVRDARAIAPGSGLVAGVATLPDGLVVVHDLRAFLDDAEHGALERALVAAPGSGP
jgi:purine-binding chemotaxis protein CheW